MAQWLDNWKFFQEPDMSMDDDFDLLQALDEEASSYEAPSLGVETSFSDATFPASTSSLCCDSDAFFERRNQTKVIGVLCMSVCAHAFTNLCVRL